MTAVIEHNNWIGKEHRVLRRDKVMVELICTAGKNLCGFRTKAVHKQHRNALRMK